jgi:uncharacterized membrane protein YoaK (UPF0700 family)
METKDHLFSISLLLSFVAGFCDTVTFVSAEELFSAHVTGNFVVFAYDVIKHTDTHAWTKLLTFPLFILSVITGGVIAGKSTHKFTLLQIEGALLILSGILAIVFGAAGMLAFKWAVYLIAFIIVFAMGLQNAFGKLFAKETYGPTTVMTGNVTQAALAIESLLNSKPADPADKKSLREQSINITGFLTGCLLGAIGGSLFGLSIVILPGVLLMILFLREKQ